MWGHSGDTVGTPTALRATTFGDSPTIRARTPQTPLGTTWGWCRRPPPSPPSVCPPGVPPIVTCCEALLPEDEDMTMNLVGGGDG